MADGTREGTRIRDALRYLSSKPDSNQCGDANDTTLRYSTLRLGTVRY